jgi:putative membrane protein
MCKPLLICGLLGLFVIAQAQSDPKTTGKDRVLAAWLIQDNEKEIAISKIGTEKAKSAEVKEFARQMVADHTSMITKLQPLVRGASEGAASREREGTPTPASARMEDSDVISLKKDLTQQCISSAKRLLEKASGAEFDKKFMQLQVMAHMEAVDTLTVFQKHASPELRGMLSDALKTVQGHLEHARSTCEKAEAQKS